jgi:Cft2 family RNA processing exonuclease
MKIKVLGAGGGEVTGSAYLIETGNARVLVDCGIFQGGKKAEAMNRFDLKDVSGLDAVLITHAHLDHTGRLPLLSKMKVPAPVFCTQATLELSSLILRDSAHVQEQETMHLNKKGRGRDWNLCSHWYRMMTLKVLSKSSLPCLTTGTCRLPGVSRPVLPKPGICLALHAYS